MESTFSNKLLLAIFSLMAKSCENAHLSPVLAQHPCLKNSHKTVFLSTPSATSGCLMSIPFVLKRNSCASFAAFFCARRCSRPIFVVGSFKSFTRCISFACFVFIAAPFTWPNDWFAEASFFNLESSFFFSSRTSWCDIPAFFAFNLFSCAGVFPILR